MARRARYHELDRLPLIPPNQLPHATMLSHWLKQGLIDIDPNRCCLVLTDSGRNRLSNCCQSCAGWTRRGGDDEWGFCRSDGRGRDNIIDADITHETEFCEAFVERGIATPTKERGS